jgi:hypothetical protein
MPINGHSRWIKYLLASHIKNNEVERNTESMKRLDKLEYGLANSFTSVGKNDGVDNTAISLNDQISDNLSKLLAGRFTKGASMFPTIIAADKSRRVEFKGFEFIDTRIHERNGEVMIPPAIVDIFVDYFSDEYNRMIQVAREIDTLDGDFSNPETEITESTELSMTHARLNTISLSKDLITDVKSEIKVRLKTALKYGALPSYSKIETIAITPYEDLAVALPSSGELFIQGNAVPTNWNYPKIGRAHV